MNRKRIQKTISLLTGMTGLVLIGAIAIPILRNEVRARQEYPHLISPIPGGGRYGHSEIQQEGQVLGEGSAVDYTLAANWFPESLTGRQFAQKGEISFYTISIPKLKIESAAVAVGGEDLTSNLIQYPGTALPGNNGNSVIFGHSVLPVFFNPSDYMSIFSTIDLLKRGDEIIVNFDGITYRYEVKETFKVKPTDVYILDQNMNDSYLSLVTCFPMGHPAKPERLVIRAKIVSS
ncbi:sortase [Candidatus Woesebacteria bacterium]|nr:MAG: sortase [Candidatus Woesebacteria bacterium]